MNDVSQFFEELLIDVDATTIDINSTLISESTTKSFAIYFGTFHDSDFMSTTNLLANKVFEHWMTVKDNTVRLAKSKPYSFNISTSSQYNNTEFKELLIDSGTVICFTRGIDQLEALQAIDKSVKLDKMTAGFGNFIFEIRSTSLIKTVNLDTPIRLIAFYIVQVYALFLLCLADINKLDIFFNNITNKLIQSTKIYPVVC